MTETAVIIVVMENASLSGVVWNNSTTSDLKLYHARDLALKVIYITVGTVGVLDNLFVIVTFALFIKITDKVLAIFTK